MPDLSFIIPARNEKYLEKTIHNILENIRGDSEILVVLDGYLPDPKIETNTDRVTFFHFPESIGQRAAINYAVKQSKAKFICKLDAHSAIDEGFDVKMMAECQPDWTMVGRMYNLDVSTWKPKLHKRTDYMYISSPRVEKPFRSTYYGSKQPRNNIMIDDIMDCMGPCFYMHKDRFLELGGMDEGHGGWGQMGIEVACKAWLSGGSMKVNKKTWFAHYFRGGKTGEGFPYKLRGSDQEKARKYSRDLWLNDKWPLAKRKFQWMIDKFDPPDWTENDLTIVYYTANLVEKGIEYSVLRSLRKHGYPIVSVSQKPMDLGKNIVVPKERSLENIYRQVLIGAKLATTKYVALCEDDCLYTPKHFRFRPKKPFGYNLNRWLLHLNDNIFTYRRGSILSQCIADREVLIKCLEAGDRNKEMGLKDNYEYENFETEEPNLVICHKKNITGRRFWGKDAEPKKELTNWGTSQYWVDKFERRRAKTS